MTEWLSEQEAADAAHVARSTIRKWVQRGLLHPRADGRGGRVFDEMEVLAVERATRRAPRLARLLTQAMRLSHNGGKPSHP